MEDEIAHFMIRAAKFEFYLVNRDLKLAQTHEINGLQVVSGVNWSKLGHYLERARPFAKVAFRDVPFGFFTETVPQFLVKTADERLKWDSDDPAIDSWERLLSRGYAQLRNNIAHGNKTQMPAPFTFDRTAKFLVAGNSLIDFVAQELFGDSHWERPIAFQ